MESGNLSQCKVSRTERIFMRQTEPCAGQRSPEAEGGDRHVHLEPGRATRGSISPSEAVPLSPVVIPVSRGSSAPPGRGSGGLKVQTAPAR